MRKYYVKIITGYEDDQKYTIDANEAHKAYYLFLNPDKRGVFENGLAIIGKDIRTIVPDYNKTMGWNHTHKMSDDDWNEVNGSGVSEKMNYIISSAKNIAYMKNEKLLTKPLSRVLKELSVNDKIKITGINKLE